MNSLLLLAAVLVAGLAVAGAHTSPVQATTGLGHHGAKRAGRALDSKHLLRLRGGAAAKLGEVCGCVCVVPA